MVEHGTHKNEDPPLGDMTGRGDHHLSPSTRGGLLMEKRYLPRAILSLTQAKPRD